MTDNDDIVTRLRAVADELFDDPDVLAAADEIERLRSEADDIARWIVRQFGYPFDTITSEPPSEPWRPRIEDAWVDYQDPADDYDIRRQVAEAGGWLK